MSDTSLNRFLGRGNDAAQAAFTPDPPTPAAGPTQLVLFLNTQSTATLKYWDGNSFENVSGSGSGTVTNTGTLTASRLMVGNGGVDITALGSLGTTTTLLHGNAAGAPTFGAVSLTADVSGDLPFANLAQIAGVSVLGVTGGSTADVAAITAGSDGHVLTRVSSSSLAFAAPAGGGNFTQLSQIVTAAAQTTVDFTSISGAYTTLFITFDSRDTAAGTSLSLHRIKINNDGTAGNYVGLQRIIGEGGAAAAGSGAAASAGGALVIPAPNDGNTAGIVASGYVVLPNYSKTTFHKRWKCEYTADWVNGATVSVGCYAGRWASTVAIDRVTFTTDGTAFVNGLVWTLYGIT